MLSVPKVSVVMSAYNAAAYLDEAVTSILDQTFRDFEFIIINNGSSDDTGSILDKHQKVDSRICVYYHKQEGLAPALNYACQLARAQYIAFMDADDISLPGRLQLQFEYLEAHPEIGILGTWVHKMNKDGSRRGAWCPPSSPKILKWTHFFGMCCCCPSTMARREILEKLDFFRPDLLQAEDVDLWLRASLITEFSCLQEILHKYRVWPGSKTQSHRQLGRETHVRILASFIKDSLSVEPPIEAVVGLRQTRVGPFFKNLKDIRLTADLIQEVGKNDLTFEERRGISWDAAKRVASLALQAERFDALASAPLFMRALKLDYRLLYPSAITRGVERRRSFTVGEEELCQIDV